MILKVPHINIGGCFKIFQIHFPTSKDLISVRSIDSSSIAACLSNAAICGPGSLYSAEHFTHLQAHYTKMIKCLKTRYIYIYMYIYVSNKDPCLHYGVLRLPLSQLDFLEWQGTCFHRLCLNFGLRGTWSIHCKWVLSNMSPFQSDLRNERIHNRNACLLSKWCRHGIHFISEIVRYNIWNYNLNASLGFNHTWKQNKPSKCSSSKLSGIAMVNWISF